MTLSFSRLGRCGLGLLALSPASALLGQTTGGTVWVRHAPVLNGAVEGSLRQMTGEGATLNSGASVSGDWQVPGTPALQLNGSSVTFGGTLVGAGGSAPSVYTITLNGNSRLGHLRTRTDPAILPTVAVPPAPAGTRSVSLNSSTQTPGDFATLRNLTLNSNVGAVIVPAGVYGDFTANSGSGFTLGTAGATTASIYAFQHLTLNSNSQLNVVGPVIVTVANGVSLNGPVAGNSAHPEWLTLQFSSGGLTLNSQVTMFGYALAPSGTVTINGRSLLAGGLVSDRLTINSNATLRLLVPVANQPPTVVLTAPPNGAHFTAPASVTLSAAASDVDGTVSKVEFFQGTTRLGESTAAPYQFTASGLAAGSYTFTARATDNGNATTDSAAIAVTVGVNQPPVVSLTSPAPGATFTAPATVPLAAAASDPDGTIAKVEFFQGDAKLGETTTVPYQFSVPGLLAGSYTFSARATDNGNVATVSSPVAINVATPPNQPPTVALTSPLPGAVFNAPATVNLEASASDPDGVIAQVEFYQGATNLGATTVAPYKFSVGGLTAGSYVFKARATDNVGGAADSALVNVSVVGVNQPPSVTLIAPLSGTIFNAPATIPLAATASDPDGTVARVEFFQGTTKLGESTVAPFAYTWSGMLPGSYALSAKAIDNLGATTLTPASMVTVQAPLPYLTDFEAAEGYTLGTLGGQGGWSVSGVASVTEADHANGVSSVVLPAGTPAAQVSRTIPVYNGQSVVFADVSVRLAAGTGADAAAASVVQAEGAKVALVRNGAQGELNAFDGDGAGAGTWRATGCKVDLGADGQTAAWLRLTLREDFSTKKWDLYANGKMIACDLGFEDSAQTLFTKFAVGGSTTAPTSFDSLFISFDNPLFTDADKDGMDDAWELAHGLNPAVDDRGGDPDGDGVNNLREYLAGTEPRHNDKAPAVTLAIAGGDNQSAFAGQFNSQPLTVVATDPATGAPAANVVVTFEATQGSGQLFGTNTGEGSPAVLLTLSTGADGMIGVYYRQSDSPGISSAIIARAGGAQVIFHTLSVAASSTSDMFYTTDFEESEGYTLGSIADQKGWALLNGLAEISTEDFVAGSRGLRLSPGEATAQIWRDFESDPGKPVVFLDIFAKPVADSQFFSSTLFMTESFTFGVRKVDDHGEIYVGNSATDGWVTATGATIPVNAEGGASHWVRFTVRMDYRTHTWDLFLDGRLVVAQIPSDSPTGDRMTLFSMTGHATATAWLDSLTIRYDNPLFADADKDGMEDGWELAHGLGITIDDSALDPDYDGLSNIQEFLRGTDPHDPDTDADGISDGWEVRHGLDPKNSADATLDRNGDGISNLQEYLADQTDSDGDGFSDRAELAAGTDPNDYYNGITPQATPMIGPDGELGPDGALSVRVSSPDGKPLVNAPTTFTAREGGHLLALTPYGEGSVQLKVRSDSSGVATVYVVEGGE